MRKIVLLGFIIAFLNIVQAQSNLTLYNMKAVPQRLAINPAMAPTCKWYFGTPALSSVDFSFNSSALALNELSSSLVPNGDKYTLDMTKLSSVFDNGASIRTGLNQEWINLGFRIRKSMWTLSINEKIKSRLLVPTDFFKLVFEGNGGANVGEKFDLGFGIDLIHSREFALGFNRSFIKDKLRLGGRFKYVIGLNAIQTERNDISFTTTNQAFTYRVKSDLKINSSLMELDSNTTLNDVLFGNPKNSGFGIDMGAQLKLNKKISLSASVVDLGIIHWKENTKSTFSSKPNTTYEYKGMDIQEFSKDSSGRISGFQSFKDTLVDVLSLDSSSNLFTTGLLGEFYVGANINITANHNLGALMYGSFYQKEFYPALTLSWNSQFARVLGLSVSYTLFKESFMNVGFGACLKLGPEQFYISTDNALGSINNNTRNLGVHFGWNHTFGKKKNTKL